MKRHWLFISIFFVLIAVRLSAYAHLPESLLPHQTYFDALRDHLGEYIWFNTQKPPLTYLMLGFLVKTFDDTAVLQRNGIMLLVYALDLLAAILLYLSAVRLAVNRYLAAIVIGLCSLAYMPLEHWYGGIHFDNYTLFFTALFAYCLCAVFCQPRARSLIALSGSSCLLITQSTVNALVVPISLVVLFLIIGRREGWLRRVILKRLIQVAAAPVLILTLLVAKNFHVATVLATSNLGGIAAMMVMQRAVGYDKTNLRNVIVSSQAPEWYLWCFDNALPATDAQGVPYPGWDLFATWLGSCYPWSKRGDEFWPYDFRPLRHRLKELGETKLLHVVDRDIADTHHRQYLFDGLNPEQSARWTGIYGNISLKVYRHFILHHPLLYLRAVRAFAQDFRSGAFVPKRMESPDGRRRPELEHLKWILIPAGSAYGMLAILGYWLLFAGWACLALLALFDRVRSKPYMRLASPMEAIARNSNKVLRACNMLLRQKPWRKSAPVQAFMILSVPPILLTAVFSSQVGVENARYFYQGTPYLFLIVLLFFNEVLKRLTIGGRKQARKEVH